MSYDTRKTRCGLNQSLHAQRMKCAVGADSPMTVADTVGAVVKARSVLTDGACDQMGLRIVFAMTSQKIGAIPLGGVISCAMSLQAISAHGRRTEQHPNEEICRHLAKRRGSPPNFN